MDSEAAVGVPPVASDQLINLDAPVSKFDNMTLDDLNDDDFDPRAGDSDSSDDFNPRNSFQVSCFELSLGATSKKVFTWATLC